jgi:hypothetical protein
MVLSKIKTKETVKDIKVLDKAAVASQRMKTALVRSKNQFGNLMDNEQSSPSEYAEDKIRYTAEDITERVGHDVSTGAKKAVQKEMETYREHRSKQRFEKNEQRVETYQEQRRNNSDRSEPRQEPPQTVGAKKAETRRSTTRQSRNPSVKTAEKAERSIKQTARSAGNRTVKAGAKSTVKSAERSVKTAEQTSKVAIKTSEATAKATQKAAEKAAKAAQKAAEIARQTSVAAQKAAAAAARTLKAAVKAIVTAVKNLMAAIIAGGWIAGMVVVIICMIGMIVGSCFGIFFSNEDTGSGKTMRQVVQAIDSEYQSELDAIKGSISYDELETSGSRAVWPDVLSVYAVKTTTDPDNPQEVASITDEKEQLLRDIFWAMNDISYRVETKTNTVIVESDDGNGNLLEEEVVETSVYLYITVSHKTADEIAVQYGFTDDQNEQLQTLLGDETSSMWVSVLYGVYSSDEQIVAVALSQIGNVGGEPYWSWYGFSSRVAWCACFVSWCAEQCGYIDAGIIPKYAGCSSGVQWFKERDQWADNSIEPTPGMIIFFDWDNKGGSGSQDGQPDHTGIVEKVENGMVYTIEGNTSNSCAERSYPVGYYEILGYGIPAY